MKNKFHIYVVFLWIVTGIAGCATTGTHSYVEPEDENSAVIESVMLRESTFVWTRVTLFMVDDRFIDISTWSGLPPERVRISPGIHRLNINVTFNHSFGSPQMSAVIPIEVNAAQGKHYVLHGSVVGTQADVWLNDASGQRASASGSGVLGISSTGSTSIVVPMPMSQ